MRQNRKFKPQIRPRRKAVKLYFTPTGRRITDAIVQHEERVICPICEAAVIQDEFLSINGRELCLYCFENGE